MIKTISSDTSVCRCDCGNCSESLTAYDWQEVKDLAHKQGWKFYKSLDKWLHFAPGHLK